MVKGFTFLAALALVQLAAGQYRTSARSDGFSLPENLQRRRPLPEDFLPENVPVRSRVQEEEVVRRRQPQTRRQLPPEDLDDPRVTRRRPPLPPQPAILSNLPPAAPSQRRSDSDRSSSRRQRQRGSAQSQTRRRQRPLVADNTPEEPQEDNQALPPQRHPLPADSFSHDPRLQRQPLLVEPPLPDVPSDPGQPLSVDQILGREPFTLDPVPPQPLDSTPPQRQPPPTDPPANVERPQVRDFQAHVRQPADLPPRRQVVDPRVQRPPIPVDLPPSRRQPLTADLPSRRAVEQPPPRRHQDPPPAPRRQTAPPPPPSAPRRPPSQPRRPSPPAVVDLPHVDRECESPNGFFPDERQCDRYYECRNGVATEGLCADGLVFNPTGAFRYLNCDSPRVVDCSGRSELQTAQPNGNCPRRYGMFAHETDCTRFWNCLDGHGTEIKCPEGLVYNDERATCDWPDNVPRCNVEEHLDFSCPEEEEGGSRQGVYVRYPHPTDCRLHYVCIPGKDGISRPRLQSCQDKLVFNIGTGHCDTPGNVDGCEKYYGDSEKSDSRQSQTSSEGRRRSQEG